MTAPFQIDIRIDVLEVEGLGGTEAFHFRRAVERELARLVSESGLPPGLDAARTIDAISLPREQSPNLAGRFSAEQLTRRIYEGLGQ